jgi:hypothetical protein
MEVSSLTLRSLFQGPPPPLLFRDPIEGLTTLCYPCNSWLFSVRAGYLITVITNDYRITVARFSFISLHKQCPLAAPVLNVRKAITVNIGQLIGMFQFISVEIHRLLCVVRVIAIGSSMRGLNMDFTLWCVVRYNVCRLFLNTLMERLTNLLSFNFLCAFRWIQALYYLFSLWNRSSSKKYNNSVCTAKKTQHFTITKINWLMLFKEIIAVYSENHTKRINTLCGNMRSYWVLKQPVHIRWALKG